MGVAGHFRFLAACIPLKAAWDRALGLAEARAVGPGSFCEDTVGRLEDGRALIYLMAMETRGLLAHYARWREDTLENQLDWMGLRGRIVTAEALEVSRAETTLLAHCASIADTVLIERQRLFPEPSRLEFVFVEREAVGACIAPSARGYLVALTTGLLDTLTVSFLQITHTQAFADLFGLPTNIHAFRNDPGAGETWLTQLLATRTPEPTYDQYAAGTELGRLALAILLNHEVGHAAHDHLAAGEPRRIFQEGEGAELPEALQKAYESQCLEIDADGFGIGAATLDCLAGRYPFEGPGAELTQAGWRGSLVAYDATSVTRSVAFANLVLWTVLDAYRNRDVCWTGSHPPPLFRALATIDVLYNNLVQVRNAAPSGAPPVDLDACGQAYAIVVDRYADMMRELGSDAARKIAGIHKQQLDAHTARLMPVWDTVREMLPKYQGRPRPGADAP